MKGGTKRVGVVRQDDQICSKYEDRLDSRSIERYGIKERERSR